MNGARNGAVVVVSVWLALDVTKLVAHDVAGLGGWPLGVLFCAAGVAGLATGVSQVRGLDPMTPRERRNAILGWGFVATLVAVMGALLIPLPWAVPAVMATAVVCWLAVIRLAAGQTARSSTR